MADPRALVRVLDELLWGLRRDGFDISTAQAIDIARAVEAVGLERPVAVRQAIACLVVRRRDERARFDRTFDRFFSRDPGRLRGTLWERLEGRGFAVAELAALRDLIDRLRQTSPGDATTLESWIGAGVGLSGQPGRGSYSADFDRLLVASGVARTIDAHCGMMLGFVTHRLARDLGAGRARSALAALRAPLVDALGERGNALAGALAAEFERTNDDVRTFVKRAYDDRVAELEHERGTGRLQAAPFISLSDTEVDEVRRAVRRFAERFRGSARVRARRARRGRLDAHRSIRAALRTGGVAFALARKDRRRDRPSVVLLCDVSDSVRAVATFLLEFTYAAQELFEQARTFVFVSDLGEVTPLFAREPVRLAIDRAWRGAGVVRSSHNSNYGRVLRTFEARHLAEIDRSTTVVILGDGRTNFHDPAPEVLDRVRARARALVWLCPEPRGQWTTGDSAMALYAPRCSAVFVVRNVRDLELAARALASRSQSRP